MAAGQLNNPKIGYIIQARMTSTRLPGKVLLPMPVSGDIPMIRQIIDQLEQGSLSAKIIVATSTNSADNELVNYCESNQIRYFRGEEEDVLSRFITLTEMFGFDVVVRLTGDNPVQDVDVIENAIQNHIINSSDLTITTGLPLGMNTEVVSGAALISLKSKKLSKDDKEHVTHYIKHSDEFRKNYVEFDIKPSYKNLRMTVDYPSDFAVLSFILSLQQNNTRNGLGLVDFVMEHYPWIFEVNSGNHQKKQFKDLNDEIKSASELLEKAGMIRAAEILREHEA